MTTEKVRVLSLDGGGAKGFYTLGALREIETLAGARLHERFRLIYGTSTGSIIAALLALGHSVDEIYTAIRPRARHRSQNIEQMPPEVRHAVFGNTRIKIAGALSAHDAGALAREMHVEARDIQTLNPMEWVVHVRGRKPTLLKQTYGVIDQFERNDHDDHSNLRELNRRLYGATARDTPNTAEPAATPQATKAEEEAPSLSDIELVITTARRLETLLETHYAASGRGLHEKITSVETQLPPHVIHAGRYVTTMRNQVVHVDAFSLPDRDWFVRCAQLFEDHFTPAATTSRIRSTPEPAAAPPHETERGDTAASRLEYDTDI